MPIYRDIYDGPPRSHGGRTSKRYIVVHNTSNDATAEEEASYAKRRPDGVSSQYYVDNNSIVQSLDTDLSAHHVGSSTGNARGISYEITGVNGWSRRQWLDRVAWPLLAAAVRRDCDEHGITPRTLTVGQIRAGDLSGVITHNQARLAWGGTTHTDPGPNFPMDHLIGLVRDDDEEDDMAISDDDVVKIRREVIGALRHLSFPVFHRGRRADGEWPTERLDTLLGRLRARTQATLDLAQAQQPLLEAAAQGRGMSPEQVAEVARAVAAAVPAELADDVADELAHRLGDDHDA